MSRTDTTDELSVPETVLRAETPPYTGREDREMDVIGWGHFLGLVVVLLPLLPFAILLWVIVKALDRITGTRS